MVRRSMEMAAKNAARTEQQFIVLAVVILLAILSMNPSHSLAGKIAGIISSLAHIPYILSIIRKDTRPSKVSWPMWTALEILTLASYKNVGADETLWVPITNIFAYGVISVMAFVYGDKEWDWTDIVCLVLSIIGIAGWLYSGSPIIGLVMFFGADFFASWSTIRQPEKEYGFAWTITLVGSALNLFAVNEWRLLLVGEDSYPIFNTFVDIIIVAQIIRAAIVSKKALRLN